MAEDALIRELSAAVERNHDAVELRLHLAELLLADGRHAEALSHCSAALTHEYQPGLQVVDLASIYDALPDDTRRVDRKARARDLTNRARQLRERFVDADPALPEILRRRDALESLIGRRLPVQTIDPHSVDP